MSKIIEFLENLKKDMDENESSIEKNNQRMEEFKNEYDCEKGWLPVDNEYLFLAIDTATRKAESTAKRDIAFAVQAIVDELTENSND